MTETIHYRAASSADVAQLAAIRARDWGSETYWQGRILGYINGELHPRQSLAPRIVIAAVEDELIVGFIAGHLTRRYDCDGELEWLNVIAERRRTGVAGELLRHLASWFADRQAKRICVDADPDNPGARAFYRKHGAEDLNPHWLVWPDITTMNRPS